MEHWGSKIAAAIFFGVCVAAGIYAEKHHMGAGWFWAGAVIAFVVGVL